VQNSRRPLRGDNNNNPFQTFACAERLTSKPTVTSKQRRRQRLFNVQSNKRAGGGARTHNYFSSSPVTANTPQIDCFGGRKLYANTRRSLAGCAHCRTKCAPVWCGGRLYNNVRYEILLRGDMVWWRGGYLTFFGCQVYIIYQPPTHLPPGNKSSLPSHIAANRTSAVPVNTKILYFKLFSVIAGLLIFITISGCRSDDSRRVYTYLRRLLPFG